MNTGSIGGRCLNLEKILHSDLLPRLVAVLNGFPSLKPLFPELLQIHLVVDANRVRGELHWRLKSRHDPANRSSLHEAIDAGVVILFAPEHTKFEIEKHYEDIAIQTGSTVSRVKQEWEHFQKSLRFYVPKMQPSPIQTYVDIDDFPYLATWKELNAQAVYTADHHIAAMGAPVVSVLIDMHLRDYARAVTIQIAVEIGCSLSLVVGLEFLRSIYKFLLGCLQSIHRLPPAIKVVMAVTGLICVAHPKSRTKLKEGWNAFNNSETARMLGNAIGDFTTQVTEAVEKATRSQQAVEAALPTRQKRPLLVHARAICVAAGVPLTLVEMERRIRAGGYVSKSQSFRKYLRQVIRCDSSFEEVSPGQWMVRARI